MKRKSLGIVKKQGAAEGKELTPAQKRAFDRQQQKGRRENEEWAALSPDEKKRRKEAADKAADDFAALSPEEQTKKHKEREAREAKEDQEADRQPQTQSDLDREAAARLDAAPEMENHPVHGMEGKEMIAFFILLGVLCLVVGYCLYLGRV